MLLSDTISLQPGASFTGCEPVNCGCLLSLGQQMWLRSTFPLVKTSVHMPSKTNTGKRKQWHRPKKERATNMHIHGFAFAWSVAHSTQCVQRLASFALFSRVSPPVAGVELLISTAMNTLPEDGEGGREHCVRSCWCAGQYYFCLISWFPVTPCRRLLLRGQDGWQEENQKKTKMKEERLTAAVDDGRWTVSPENNSGIHSRSEHHEAGCNSSSTDETCGIRFIVPLNG